MQTQVIFFYITMPVYARPMGMEPWACLWIYKLYYNSKGCKHSEFSVSQSDKHIKWA